MSELMLLDPVELTDAEVDLVAGGVQGGLVNVLLSDTNIALLNGFKIDVDVPITLRNVANNNNVGVGAIIQALGGVALIRQNQV